MLADGRTAIARPCKACHFRALYSLLNFPTNFVGPILQSDFENASMGSPSRGPGSAAAAAQQQQKRQRQARDLRANSEDEWSDEEEKEELAQQQPQAAAPRCGVAPSSIVYCGPGVAFFGFAWTS